MVMFGTPNQALHPIPVARNPITMFAISKVVREII